MSTVIVTASGGDARSRHFGPDASTQRVTDGLVEDNADFETVELDMRGRDRRGLRAGQPPALDARRAAPATPGGGRRFTAKRCLA